MKNERPGKDIKEIIAIKSKSNIIIKSGNKKNANTKDMTIILQVINTEM